MRFVLLLLIALSPLCDAALTAEVTTNRGKITVELQYTKAPKTVANFMTLAQGTRPHIDLKSGAVVTKPFYIGEKFYRIVNQAGFRIAQTGSGTGSANGDPGFTFKDEFDAALTHVPYVLSMANSGPNTNGSQIFITGNSTIPSLDKVHTVFGLVKAQASKNVIDVIMAAGNNGTTITAITFQRTDAAARAFNEQAQGLPSITRPGGILEVKRNNSSKWNFATPIGTGAIFRAFRSNSLLEESWSELPDARLHLGLGPAANSPQVTLAALDGATTPAAFYNLSLVEHPAAVAPTSLANRKVTVTRTTSVTEYLFDTTGRKGTLKYTPSGTGSAATGTFNVRNPADGKAGVPYSTGAHDINFDAYSTAISPQEIWVRIGCDTATATLVAGHHYCLYWGGSGWVPMDPGTATISR